MAFLTPPPRPAIISARHGPQPPCRLPRAMPMLSRGDSAAILIYLPARENDALLPYARRGGRVEALSYKGEVQQQRTLNIYFFR